MSASERVQHELVTSAGTITRRGTLTGEVSPAGMLRVEWDEDGHGRMGWLEPGSFTRA